MLCQVNMRHAHHAHNTSTPDTLRAPCATTPTMFYRYVCLLGSVSLAKGFHLHVRTLPKLAALPISTTADAPQVSPVSTEEQDGQDLFDWNKQWYPVLSLKNVDTGRAHAVQLLGKDLVVWRDAQEKWACFDDRCPHRAAPLTEGRVEEDGSLLCAYHAWRFDSDGKCLSIPQSNRGGADEAQPAACAKVNPTQVAQDLIWVWGENGPDAGLESALTQPALIPELSDVEGLESGRVVSAPVGHRDLPYGWDTFMENVLDPSHVPVSHHGITGNRYKDAQYLKLEPQEGSPTVSKGGFGFFFLDGPGTEGARSNVCFVPPALAVNEVDNAEGGKLKLVLYATPTRPGWCRMIGRQVSIESLGTGTEDKKTKKQKRSPSVKAGRIAAKVPSWLQHTMGSMFMHQDLVFLHHQEKTLASAGYDSSTYGKAVFTPAAADRAVLALRNWISKYGGGGPAWADGCDHALPPREHNRNVLFDVYEQHTKDCASCLAALKRVNKGLNAARASAAVSLAWAVLRGARAPSAAIVSVATARAMLPAVAVSLASLGAVQALEKLRGMFYTYPYHHQDNP